MAGTCKNDLFFTLIMCLSIHNRFCDLPIFQEKANGANDFVMRIKLTEALNQFKQDYSNDPSCLIRVLRNCVICEQKIIAQYEASSGQQGLSLLGSVSDPTLTILQEMGDCRRNAQVMEDQIKQMQQKEEAFVIQYQDMQKRNAHLQQLQANGQSTEIIQRTQQEGAQFEALIKESARELHQARLSFEKRITGKQKKRGCAKTQW